MFGVLGAAAGLTVGYLLGLDPGWWMAGPLGVGAIGAYVEVNS